MSSNDALLTKIAAQSEQRNPLHQAAIPRSHLVILSKECWINGSPIDLIEYNMNV